MKRTLQSTIENGKKGMVVATTKWCNKEIVPYNTPRRPKNTLIEQCGHTQAVFLRFMLLDIYDSRHSLEVSWNLPTSCTVIGRMQREVVL